MRCVVNRYKQVVILLLTAAVALTASCSTKQPLPTEEERREARMKAPCIIALPVTADLKSNDAQTNQSAAKSGSGAMYMDRELKEVTRMQDSNAFPVITEPPSDAVLNYQTAAILENGAEYVEKELKEALGGYNNVRFLSQRQLTSLLPETEISQAAMLGSIRSELKCNAVLVTSLSRYVQRVGGDYGADSPASVAFSMKLFDTSDGSVLWSATFDETQQSLMSNIMSAHKYGLKWLTVDELVTLGIRATVEQSPYF